MSGCSFWCEGGGTVSLTPKICDFSFLGAGLTPKILDFSLLGASLTPKILDFSLLGASVDS